MTRIDRAVTAARPACAATLSFEDALAILAAGAQPLGTETVPLSKAGRRVLAEPVTAAISAPRGDRAAMDGFAVRQADVDAGVRRFHMVATAYPGREAAVGIAAGEAVRIMTGARMPDGGDRVVVCEAAVVEGDHVRIDRAPAGRPHVRGHGSDFDAGDVLLPAGRVVDPRAMVVAAAADRAMLQVWRRPRLSVIAAGDELVAPGEASASPWAVPDSLSEAMLLLARQWGAKPTGAVRVGDDADALRAAIGDAAGRADVVAIVGGASHGDRDFGRPAALAAGAEMRFADVAIKPGKPVWCARLGDTALIGLPGNPTAAMTVARLFLAPLIGALGGRGFGEALGWRRARLLTPLPAGGDRDAFLCARIEGDEVAVIARQSASAQHLLADADCLVRRARGTVAAEAGDWVEYIRF